MKKLLPTAMAVVFAAVFAMNSQGAEVVKDNNTTALNNGASWVGAAVPGATDVAVWNNTVLGANNAALGGDVAWGGIKVTNPGGLVTVGTDANILTLGTSGIDLSSATQSLYLNGASLNVGANSQTWNVGASYLRLGNGNLDGVLSGSGTISISGSGIVDLNPNATGASGFSGKWIINSGATLRTTRHSQSGDWDALGSNTSSDAVTLAGGTLAVGGFTGSGAQGDWTWANPITLASSTSSTISGQLPDTTGGARVLTLTGAITGSGNLAFSKNQLRTMNFVLNNLGTTAGSKSNVMGTGDITVTGVTLTLRAGSTGNTMTHNNNINLSGATLVSDDANQVFAGNISLSGANTIQARWSGKNATLNGTISGSGSVTYSTANAADIVIAVNGNNTYSGGTTLGSGSANSTYIVAGHNNAFGTGAIAFRGGRLYAGTSGLTIANDMTVGAGGVRLGGTNSYTLSGTLTMDAASRTIANYSTNGSTITIGGINAIAGSTVSFDNAAGGATGAPIVVSGAITGAGKVALSGAHNTTLNGVNTYTDTTTLSGGRLNLGGSIGASSAVTASGGLISGAGTINGTLTMSGTGIRLVGGATTTSLTFANGVTFTANTPVTFDTAPIASTIYDIFTYGSGTVTGGSFVTQTGYRGAVSDDAANQKYIFTAGAVADRTWNTTTGTWDVGTSANWVEGDNLFYSGDTVTFGDIASDSTVTLTGSLSPGGVTVQNSANTYTFQTGSIVGTTGLTKTGDGSLVLTSKHTYTGGTTVNGGVLDLAVGGETGALAGTVTVNSGGTLRMSVGDATGWGTSANRISALNINGGTVSIEHTTGNQTFSNMAITMTGGTITGNSTSNFDLFNNGSSVTTLASATASTISTTTMNLRQNDTVFNIADGAATQDLLISAIIGNGSTGNHNLIKTGAGTMVLTAANTYTGNTTINGGTLKIGTGGSLYSTGGYFFGAGVTISGGGVLETRNWDYGNGNALNQLRNNYFAVVLDNGTVRFTENTSSLRAFQVNSGGATIEAVSGVTYTKQAGTTDSQNIIYGNNAGTLTFTGAGNIVIADGIGTYGTWGTAGVTKTGAGTLTLSGANTYTGDTTVVAGVLEVTGSLVSEVTAQSGTTVTGNGGTFGGGLIMASGSTHAPGASPGTQIVADTLTYDDATLVIDIWTNDDSDVAVAGTDFDQIQMTGDAPQLTLTSAPQIVVDLNNTYNPAVWNSYKIITGIGTTTGVFNGTVTVQNASTDWTNSGSYFRIDYGADNIALTVIPEPATFGLVLAFGAAAVIRRRRIG